MNSQTVQWIVVHEEKDVQRLAELTIDWIRSHYESDNPPSTYAVRLVLHGNAELILSAGMRPIFK